MATKALPAAKVDPKKFLPARTTKVSAANIVKREKKDDESGELLVVHSKIIKIENLIKTNFKIDQDAAKKKRIRTEKQKQQAKEDELEEQPKGDEKPGKKISLPRLSFLEKIKNFLFNMILGFVAIKLLPHLPKLLSIIPKLWAFAEGVLDWSGKLFNAMAGFVAGAYELRDKTLGFMKQLGGDGLVNAFKFFEGAIGKVLEAALFIMIASGGEGGLLDQATSLFADKIIGGIFRRGIGRAGGRLGLKVLGKQGVKRATTLAGKASLKGVARFGAQTATRMIPATAKGILSVISKALSSIPVIGGLVEFVISWAMGDPIGKAAFKGIGAGLGSWAGMALMGLIGTVAGAGVASWVTGPIGAAIGAALGGMAGSAISGFLYDLIFGDATKPSKPRAQMAGGGQAVQRKSKQGKRPARKRKPRYSATVFTTPFKPGVDSGGRKKLDKMFPDTTNFREYTTQAGQKAWWDPAGVFTGNEEVIKEVGSTKKRPMDPMGYMEEVYETTNKAPFFGPMMGSVVKLVVGEKPTKRDYKNIGTGLNAWMYSTFGDVVSGYERGGEVSEMFLNGEDLTDVIAKSVEESVHKKVNDSITDLRNQLSLDTLGGVDSQGRVRTDPMSSDLTDTDTHSGATAGYTSGTAGGRWGPVLDLIRKYEGSGYDSAWPSTTKVAWDRKQGVKNPKPLTELTIGEADAWQERTYRARSRGTILSSAAGAYQFMYIKNMAKKYAGLGPDEPFSAENQDKMAIGLIEQKRKINLDMLKNNPAEAQRLLALEWASLPKDTSNRGAYSGQGGKVKSSEVREAFKKVLSGGSGERTIQPTSGQSIPGVQTPSQSQGTRAGSVHVSQHGFAMRPAIPGVAARDWHMGQDISASPTNSQLIAFNPGVIQAVGTHSGYGNWINWKDTKTGLYNFYAHMPRSARGSFRSGQRVGAGTVLGLQGNTGTSSGPHLHWEVSTTPGGGGREKMPISGRGPNRKDAVGRVAPLSKYNAKAPFGFALGGFTGSRAHLATLGEEGREFVLDADSTRAMEDAFPGLLSKLNREKYAGTIKTLRSYAEYEVGASQEVGVPQQVADVIIASVPKPTPVLIPVGGGGVSDDHRAILDNGH